MQSGRVVSGRWFGCCGLLCLALAPPVFAGERAVPDAAELQQVLEQTRADLRRLNRYASDAADHIARLEQRLAEAEGRNRAQAERIEQLGRDLRQAGGRGPAAVPVVDYAWQQRVFAAVVPSPVAEVGPDYLRIPTDAVFVFGTGELGAEGRDRLQPVVRSLIDALGQLPPDMDWRLEVAGHTDRRPLRGSARFASNWDLSAARAVAVLRYLHEQGVANPRLAAMGYGASEPLDGGMDKASHRRNRRVEIRLRIRPGVLAAN